MDIKIADILKISKNSQLICGSENIICENFSKDTRTLNQGDVYVGIKGENFDGNTLYKEAFDKGASVCILQGIKFDESEINEFKDKAIILVDDTVNTLQEIAKYKRSLFNIPVIAITGSVGKTSTKDIVASVVNTEYKVLKTQGNLNNHIGLPMTILGLKNHEALVVEMGMSSFGEISLLSKIAKPNIAVITNIGTSHIGNLGSRENILKAKLEILDGMAENTEKLLIINNDNDLLHKWAEEYTGDVKILTYGIENKSDLMATDIELFENSSKFNVFINNKTEKVNVPVGGNHFVYNSLCALSVGKVLGISNENMLKGIEEFELSKSRMELIKLSNNVTIINDCYNASYDSMKAGIEYLAKISGERKIAILGDMFELGEFSKELHEKVGMEVLNNNIDVLVTVGEMGKVISNVVSSKNADVYAFDNNMEASEFVKKMLKSGDVVLIKASNGMKFKEIVDALK